MKPSIAPVSSGYYPDHTCLLYRPCAENAKKTPIIGLFAIRNECKRLPNHTTGSTSFIVKYIAKEEGLYNLFISNGFINKKPLLELCKVLHAANIDLKSINDAIYRKLNGGYLKPVLRTLMTLHDQGIHFEIATLVIPGYVDDPEMLKQMCGWILNTLGPDYPY